jgi:hypothetical protein
MTIHLVLLILAFLCFALAAAGVVSRVNLVAAGLAIWVLSLMLP